MKQKQIEKQDRAKRRRNIILAAVIVFLMVSSAFAVFLYSDQAKNSSDKESGTLNYNGYNFYNVDSKWATYYNNQYVYFDFNPKELEGIPLDKEIVIPSSSQKIYIAQDYTKDRANEDFSVRHLAGVLTLIGIKSVASCIDENNCPDIPLVSCSGDKEVLYINSSSESGAKTRVYKNGNCVIFEGGGKGVLQAINKYEYFVLGVIKK